MPLRPAMIAAFVSASSMQMGCADPGSCHGGGPGSFELLDQDLPETYSAMDLALAVTISASDGSTSAGTEDVVVDENGAYYLNDSFTVGPPDPCYFDGTISFSLTGSGAPSELASDVISVDVSRNNAPWTTTDALTLWNGWVVTMRWLTWKA